MEYIFHGNNSKAQKKITLDKQIEDHSVCLPLKEKHTQLLETWEHIRAGSRLHSAKMVTQGNISVIEISAGIF